MQLSLYNTESRRKDPVTSISGKVRMYTCGPTIYDFAHIGNFRTYVFEDLLRKTLKLFGFSVEQAMNITDIDDKTIRGAIKKNVSLKAFTEPYRIAFFEDLQTLEIEKVEYYPLATDYISEMIRLIEILLQKGHAYECNGSIYYKIHTFPSYGRLSHLNLNDLKPNASGDNLADEYGKEAASDFVLWKGYDPERDGKIFWQSPFGPGRPGWHIECSAMAMNLLGESIDIHCGGVDNMFPHHENEIAQSEGCTGSHFVRHWVHVEHLLVDHRKMSKSLGNFYTLRDLLNRGYTGREVRYLLLSTHYRTQLNFSFAGLDGARASLERIEDLISRLREVDEQGNSEMVFQELKKAEDGFTRALSDDLNISVALSVVFDLIRELNALCDEKKVSQSAAKAALDLLSKWDAVLGVFPLNKKSDIPQGLHDLLVAREDARKRRDFTLSDQLRDAILEQGYMIEDTPKGARLKKR